MRVYSGQRAKFNKTYVTGFLPGIFSEGKIYCYANIFCYANFSIAFGTKFKGAKVSGGGGKLLQGGAPYGRKPGIIIQSILKRHVYFQFPPE